MKDQSKPGKFAFFTFGIFFIWFLSSAQSGIRPGSTSGSGTVLGTTNTVSKFTSSSAVGDSNITDTGSLITLNGNVVIDGNADEIQFDILGHTTQTAHQFTVRNFDGSATQFYVGPNSLPANGTLNWTRVQGTFPTTPTNILIGSLFDITGAGNQSFAQVGVQMLLRTGYTGASATFAFNGANDSAGTGADLNVDGNGFAGGNQGIYAAARGTTTGLNIGSYVEAFGGNTNYGVVGKALVGKNDSVNVGVLGIASNSGTGSLGRVGVLAALGNPSDDLPFSLPGVDAGVLVDNTNTALPLIVARDAGVNKFVVNKGGIVQFQTPQDFTVADSGGGGAATGTLTPTHSYVEVTCNDADGCNITMGETGILEGHIVKIVNVSTNAANFADTAGVSELEGAIALGQYDILTLIYIGDRWVEESTKNN